MAEIPQKSMYRIGEVCDYTDTQPYVLRFWESEFPQLTPVKSDGGQRMYRREDVDLILRIKKLLYEEEYTIAGARKQLEQEAGRSRSAARGGSRAARARPRDVERGASDSGEDGPLFRSTTETVERERYENAVHEIQRLRREHAQLEEDRNEQMARAQELELALEEQRERAERVAEQLERLAGSIES